MARDAEVTALGAIETAYDQWTGISDQLHHQVAAAAERQARPPAAALRADFDAQLAVTRSVITFAEACPASGPDVEGLPGAAFIQAMHHVVRSQPGLDSEIVTLTRRWEKWLAEVTQWTPDLGSPPPTRPTSPAHSRVLAAVDDWWGFGANRLHDQIVQSARAQGHHITESLNSGPGGETIQSTHVVFDPAQQRQANTRSEGALRTGLRKLFRPRTTR